MTETDRLKPGSGTLVVIFTSPKAGSGEGRHQLPRLISILQEQGVDVRKIDSIAELIATIAGTENPIIVAAGGDGTIAMVAASVSSNVPIVPMPMGTENLLARYFGHRRDAEAVAETVRSGSSKMIDVGVANGKPFLIMATSGFDAEVVRAMHLTRRGHIGRFSYLAPIARAIRKYHFPGIRIRIDGGEPIEAGWAMVFNLPSYAASLAIEPGAIANDGQLDVIAFRGRSIAKGLWYLAGIKAGRHLDYADVVRCRGRSIEIDTSDTPRRRVPFQTDGDYAGRLPLSIETLPGRVQLLLPLSFRMHPF